MSNTDSPPQIQSVLSIGYIYLIVMGIINETLHYSQLGINILEYSDVLDVLLSPLAKITSNLAGVLFVLFFVLAIFILPSYLPKKKNKTWFKKFFKGIDTKLSDKEIERSIFMSVLFLASLAIFGFFIGTGAGGGYEISKKIENKEIEYNDQIVFNSNESEQVEIVGKNSSYLFYLTEESKAVKISPIKANIKSITEIK